MITLQRLSSFLPNILFTTSAIAPSPVTLHAVPKLSIAMYSAIINAWASELKPKILAKGANAA